MTRGSERGRGADPSAVPRVLILSLVFAPDGVSTAQLMTELATDLRRRCRVFVVTTRPHYNRDVVAEAAQPLTPVWPGLLWRSEVGGVAVYHTRVSARSGGFLARAAGWLMFHVLALAATLAFVRRADVVFVPSPLLTLGVLGRILARPLGARLVYNVQELYPDLAIDLGMLRNRALIAVLLRLERYVYRHAAVVTAITEGIRRAIVAKGIDAARVVTIPNFVDVGELAPGARDNAFAREHGWGGRFVVLYAGNMGHAQGLEALVRAAQLLEQDPTVLIAFVGDGVARESLERLAAELRLRNVAFVGYQPYARMPEIYAAADVSVASLASGIVVGALPSKVFRIMACERPILALCDPRSDLATTVREAAAGEVAPLDDTRAIADAILRLKSEPGRAAAMGASGRAYVVRELARPVVTGRYATLFASLR